MKIIHLNADGSIRQLCPFCESDCDNDDENTKIIQFAISSKQSLSISLKKSIYDDKNTNCPEDLVVNYETYGYDIYKNKNKDRSIKFIAEVNYCPMCGRQLREPDK